MAVMTKPDQHAQALIVRSLNPFTSGMRTSVIMRHVSSPATVAKLWQTQISVRKPAHQKNARESGRLLLIKTCTTVTALNTPPGPRGTETEIAPRLICSVRFFLRRRIVRETTANAMPLRLVCKRLKADASSSLRPNRVSMVTAHISSMTDARAGDC